MRRLAAFSIISCIVACSGGDNFAGGSGAKQSPASPKPTPTSDDSDGGDSPSPAPKPAPQPTPAPSPEPNALPNGKSLTITPASARVFKSESTTFAAAVDGNAVSGGDLKWSVDPAAVATISGGVATGAGGGDATIGVSYEGLTAKAKLTVIKCKDDDVGTAAQQIHIGGENYPNNNVDPGGADYNDYTVDISGAFLVNGYEIFSTADQDITIRSSPGSSGSTTQVVTLKVIDCDNKAIGSHDITSGTVPSTMTLHAAKGDRFDIYTVSTTGSYVQHFDLVTDAAKAFRLRIDQ